MSAFAYFEQVERKIDLLLAEKKYNEAYSVCLALLEKFPEEKKFLKLKRKIEEEVGEENDKYIKEKFSEIKPLWKEKKYKDILKTLKPLIQVAPHHEKLKKEILKAQELYKEEIDKQKKEFQKTQIKRLTELFNKDENQLLDELFYLEKNNPGNKDIQVLTALFRDKLINRKIKEKEELIYSDKYDAIENFISQLKKIDKENKRISELEKIVHSRKHGTQLADKNEYIYKAESHLDTLMRLKKYDKAIQVAHEIIEIDKKNQKILSILKKAEKKYFKQTKDEAIESIKNNLPNLKEDYIKNKKNYIKI